MKTYRLLDSGHGEKLEAFGDQTLIRPCSQAVWNRQRSDNEWDQAAARFSREERNNWEYRRPLPKEWVTEAGELQFLIRPTPFGHLGLFPEQVESWNWIREQKPKRLLNLFAYSGGASLAAAQAGAEVCHVDASKGMVTWARENAALNKLEQASIRWIVDDVVKFLEREKRRGRTYDSLVLDPPTFGRGANGEVFKIEEHLTGLLDLCREILEPKFVLLSCHTPGYSPLVMEHLLRDMMGSGSIEIGELLLTGDRPVPSGVFGRWTVE